MFLNQNDIIYMVKSFKITSVMLSKNVSAGIGYSSVNAFSMPRFIYK